MNFCEASFVFGVMGPIHQLKRRFIFFSISIVSLIIAVQAFIRVSIGAQESDMMAIQSAVQQSHTGQEMTKTLLAIEHHTSKDKELTQLKGKFEDLFNQWKKQHFLLVNGGSNNKEDFLNNAFFWSDSDLLQFSSNTEWKNSDSIVRLLETATPSFLTIKEEVEQVISTNYADNQASLESILNNEDKYNQSIIATATQFGSIHSKKMDWTMFLQLMATVLLSGGALIMVWKIIFTPALCQVKKENLKQKKLTNSLELSNRQLLNNEHRLRQTIEQIRRTKRTLIEANKKAEEAGKAKERFLSTMSHELRTPLNSVIGLAHLLLEESKDNCQRDKLETLKFSSETLLSLINDVLDLNRLSEGKVRLHKEDFDLHNFVHETIQTLRPQADTKGLNLKLEVDQEVPEHIHGDRFRLSQILINLLGNAIKFTEQGEVSLHLSMKEQKGKKAQIHFEVKDTGIGIPKEKQAHIFEHFCQADDEMTRKFGGSGLGLSISKQLVDLHGGNLQVKSEEGQGANFHFTIKVDVAKAPQRLLPKHQPMTTQPLTGMNVLMAEDNLLNVMVAQEFLEKWGAKVTVAENGRQAIDHFLEKDFHLVLMDLQMPEMDGYEASKVLRSEKLSNKVPIIALTAESEGDLRERIMNHGMNDLVTKPFKPDDLLNAIKKNMVA